MLSNMNHFAALRVGRNKTLEAAHAYRESISARSSRIHRIPLPVQRKFGISFAEEKSQAQSN
jgi:hypothetical protein